MTALLDIQQFDDLAAPPKLVSAATTAEKTSAVASASDLALGYLQARYVLPLQVYGEDLRQAVAHIALWYLLGKRGYTPVAPNDRHLFDYQRAIAWLEQVRDGKIRPAGLVDSATPPAVAGTGRPRIVTNPRRGW